MSPPLMLSAPALDGLSTDELDQLYAEACALEAQLRARVLTRARVGGAQGPGKVYGIEEAARRLGTSVDSLYRKHKAHGLGYKDGLDGKLKFSEAELDRYVAKQRRGR